MLHDVVEAGVVDFASECLLRLCRRNDYSDSNVLRCHCHFVRLWFSRAMMTTPNAPTPTQWYRRV